MKILIIAPFPPPITGQSLAVEFFKKNIPESYLVECVDLSKRNVTNGKNSLKRIIELIKIFYFIKQRIKNVNVIYFTISESLFGNIKDLFIYILCYKHIDKMVIHLHGGAGFEKIMKLNIISYFNKFFIKKIKLVIVLGETFTPIFDFLPKKNIHIINNFANSKIRFSKGISTITKSPELIKIIFVSNHLSGKGHFELLEAYKTLPIIYKNKISIQFAGGFDSKLDKKVFMSKIEGLENIKYLGIVTGVEKKQLFHEADIFCLPTYYPFEGQPISIIEAYASSCAVITTNHSGIFDIFKPGYNGFFVEKRSSESIKKVLIEIVDNENNFKLFQKNNLKDFDTKFTEEIHLKKMISSILD